MAGKEKNRKDLNIAHIKVDIKENENTANLDQLEILPPDGGWGWVVVSVSFTTNFMSWGTLLSSGVFLEEFCVVGNKHSHINVVIRNRL